MSENTIPAPGVRKLTVSLAGNPNAGKTSLFNAITGAHQHVGNYPGVTVEFKEGNVCRLGCDMNIVDLPGTYSLTAYSPEEVVARNQIIEGRPDVVINVVDASNLERNLYLTVQLLELGAPVVISLNMVDVAESRGMKIDPEKLSELLGVPVVPTVARKGEGIDELLLAASQVAGEEHRWRPINISYGVDIDEGLKEILEIMPEGRLPVNAPARWIALKCLEDDNEVLEKLREWDGPSDKISNICHRISDHLNATLDDEPESLIADYRYGFITGVSRQALTVEREVRMEFSDKVDRVLTNRLLGPLFLLAVVYGVYQFVFWASEAPVGWLEGFFGWLTGAVASVMPDGLLQSLIVSGVIDGVGGVLGFVPLIMFMFFAIAIMEDSGYMARMAYIMDRVLRAFGLHGNSLMSLIVSGGISGGCAVPGVMSTRTLKDPKARLATILVVPFMNCGAKLPVYAVLISAFFPNAPAQYMFALTIISWCLALLAAKVLRSTVLKGESSPFVMELPPYRMPTLRGLLIHTWERSWQYIKKAGTLLLWISILMWTLMTFPHLPQEQAEAWQAKIDAAPNQEEAAELSRRFAQDELGYSFAGRMGKAMGYVTEPLGFDWRTNVALVGGFAAKEVIVATLGTAYSLGDVDPEEAEGLSERLASEPGWSAIKAFALMLFVMIYSPCVATIAVMKKETGGWKWPAFSLVYTTTLAYIIALVVYQGGNLLKLGG